MAERKRGGLGRGIGALIPTGPEAAERPVDVFFPDRTSERAAAVAEGDGLVAVPGARLASLSPDDIAPNPVNPRKEFDGEAMAELVTSVREFGVLQPLVVRPRPGALPGQPQYELIMGERRLRAAKTAGLESVPAVVRETAEVVKIVATIRFGNSPCPAVGIPRAYKIVLREALGGRKIVGGNGAEYPRADQRPAEGSGRYEIPVTVEREG